MVLAKPRWGSIAIGLWAFLAFLAPGIAAPRAQAAVTYGGPLVLKDPADPLQSVRWTLGLYSPPRTRLSLGRYAVVPWMEYDPERDVVLLSYRAGNEEILPPLAFPTQEFAVLRFQRDLYYHWLRRTRGVLVEARSQSGQSAGLVNLSLPFELPFTERIFGEGAPNLKVSGSEQITISGTSSWVVGQVSGERGGGSLFPKLDMRQRLNVNLQGTIGSKLFVSVAQNSEALTPLENSMKIRYQGEEDEVIKNVELGNTNLSLPSTQFVSFSARQEGLFGVKAEGQVGPIDFTAIASRQQGESGQASLSGGAQVQNVRVEDWRFIPRKYFFLSDPDSLPIVPQIDQSSILVYLDDRDYRNDVELAAQPSQVWLDPENPDSTQWRPRGKPYAGWFHLLVEEDDYRILQNGNFSQPLLVLRSNLSSNQVLAVAYNRPTYGIDGRVGGFEADSLLQLKMVLPGQDVWGTDTLSTSVWASASRLELKNAYSLGARNIDPETFDLKIVQDLGGSNPSDLVNEYGKRTPFLRLLGLDQKNNSNVTDYTPDGKVDPEFIDYAEGVVFFPDLRPFDPGLADIEGIPKSGFRARTWPILDTQQRPDTLGWRLENGRAVPSSADQRNVETAPEIYDLRSDRLSRDADQFHLYTLEASFKTAVNTIQLSALGNILEGSETVRLNGEILTRGEDYTIQYDTGQITLKNPDATAPGADLQVNYGFDTPFTRGARSLLGFSLSKREEADSKLSFSTSWLFDNRSLPDQRPRLGEEPTKTVVGDVSGRLRLRPWSLTRFANRLPFVSTSVPSQLEVSGAMGISLPNPNTRGDVFIDDMEGTELITSAGLSRYSWSLPSAPVYVLEDTLGADRLAVPSTDRGQLLWFSPNTVRVEDLNPGEDNQNQRDDIVSVLEVLYVPSEQATQEPWGGLVTTLSPSGTNLNEAQYIDVWLNDYKGVGHENERRGELFIDVGTVSEDAVWDPRTPPLANNGVLDYEDLNRNGGQVEASEDLGLDRVLSEQEVPDTTGRRGPLAYPSDELLPRDRSGDDYIDDDVETDLPEHFPYQRILKYQHLNGTEDNRETDSEDLDGDFNLSTLNDYNEYRIDLAAPAFIDYTDTLGNHDPDKAWRLYRIPLGRIHQTVGAPDLSTVKHLRMWFRGFESPDTLSLQIASIEIVGNRWEVENTPGLLPGETFAVAVVNNKENAEYVPPYAPERINSVEEREQSISLDFLNLAPGRDVHASRSLLTARDYTLYQDIAYFVNPRLESTADSVEFYMRFGSEGASDTLSYYEIATVLTLNDPRRRAHGWYEINFNVADMSAVKIGAPPAFRSDAYLVGPGDGPDSPGGPRVDLGEGLLLTVRGLPSMSRVRRVSMGVRNVSEITIPRGRVWVDELRMGEVRRDRGVASRAALNLVMADVLSVNGNVTQTSADFLRLGEVRGSGTSRLNYTVNGQVNLHKFLEPLRIDAPLRVSYKRGRNVPKFFTNSDILFEGVASGRDITEDEFRDINLSLARNARGTGPWWTRYTLDGLRLNGRLSRTANVGTVSVDTTSQIGGSASWGLTPGIRPLRFFRKFDFAPWPRTLQLDLAGGETTRRAWSRSDVNPDSLIRTVNTIDRQGSLQFTGSINPIRILTYQFRSARDLVDSHFGLSDSVVTRAQNPSLVVLGVDVGREIVQSHSITANYAPPVLQTLLPRLTWNSGSETNRAPSLTRADWDSTVVGLNNNSTASLNLSVPLGDLMGKLVGADPGPGARPRAPADTSKGGPNPLRRLFTDVVGFRTVQGSASLGRRSAVTGVHGNAPIPYLLGLSRDPGLGTSTIPVQGAPFNQSLGEDQTFRGSTSLSVFRQITVDVSYQKRLGHTRTNASVGRVTDDTTWPELRFNWGDLQRRIPLVKRVFQDFRVVNTSYSRGTQTTGTDENPSETVTTRTNWQPLVSIQGTLKGAWRINMNLNKSSSTSRTERLGGGASISERSTTGYTFTLGKQINAGKGKQEVDLNADFSYNTNSSVTRSGAGGIPPQRQATDDIAMNTTARFRFTKTISGTFGVNLRQQRNVAADWTRRSVGLSFTTGFNF